jgi:hypothetical protein
MNQGRIEVTARRWLQQLPDDIKETRILETERKITRSTSVENWHYQSLQTGSKTDYDSKERYQYRITAAINNFPINSYLNYT